LLINKYWYYLTGANDEFSLESRIFHSFCLVAFFVLSILVPLNLFLGLQVSALLSAIALITQSTLYYLSRFRHLTQISPLLSIFIIHIIIIINYFYNSEIQEPSLLLLVAIFFWLYHSQSQKNTGFFISFNLVVAISLPLSEYLNPGLVDKLEMGLEFRFGDMIGTYLLSILTILIGLRYIKKNYNISQSLLEAKAIDLERINSTKNKLFTIVSHDLRAPLANVKGYLEILSLLDPAKDNWQEIQNDLIEMTQNTDNMLSNILMWSTSQMDGITPNKKQIDLSNTLIPVIKVFQSIANAKQIALTFDIDPEIKVLADENMLQLVIRNILSNAIKFTPNGGNIKLDVDSNYPKYVIKIAIMV